MLILNTKIFYNALKSSGFPSIEALAKHLGIHRNTIHHYLSGHRVLPEGLEKIMDVLGLKPHDAFIEKEPEEKISTAISRLIDTLHQEFPQATFVLFGSRAQGRSQTYSDWDIGVYSAKGIDHAEYRKMLLRKDELVEDMPFFVDIVNLSRADAAFLHNASKGWMFLTGRLNDWSELKRKAAA